MWSLHLLPVTTRQKGWKCIYTVSISGVCTGAPLRRIKNNAIIVKVQKAVWINSYFNISLASLSKNSYHKKLLHQMLSMDIINEQNFSQWTNRRAELFSKNQSGSRIFRKEPSREQNFSQHGNNVIVVQLVSWTMSGSNYCQKLLSVDNTLIIIFW